MVCRGLRGIPGACAYAILSIWFLDLGFTEARLSPRIKINNEALRLVGGMRVLADSLGQTLMRRRLLILGIAALAVVACIGFYVSRNGGASESTVSQPAAPTPAPVAIPVVAGNTNSGDVPIYLRGIGTVIAYNTVVVRSQVSGQIAQIAFTEGQTVKAGDLLAQIVRVPSKPRSTRCKGSSPATRRSSPTPRSTSRASESLEAGFDFAGAG